MLKSTDKWHRKPDKVAVLEIARITPGTDKWNVVQIKWHFEKSDKLDATFDQISDVTYVYRYCTFPHCS